MLVALFHEKIPARGIVPEGRTLSEFQPRLFFCRFPLNAEPQFMSFQCHDGILLDRIS
jgi:hypothetical protein